MTYENIFLEWTLPQGLDFTASLEFKHDLIVVVTFVLSRVFLSCFSSFCDEHRPQLSMLLFFLLGIFSYITIGLSNA